MKDIKSLYNAVKFSQTPQNIKAYEECINSFIENSPYEYVSNLEYIISSSLGVKTLNSFIEKNGLPIPCFENVMNVLESTIQKCQSKGMDYSIFKNVYNEMVEFHNKYQDCFDMYEYYNLEDKDLYVKTYYEKNENGVQKSKLAAGMIKTFKEASIPDTIIIAHSINENVNNKLVKYISENYNSDALLCEWVLRVQNGLNVENTQDIIQELKENSISFIVDKLKSNHHSAYRESVILGTDFIFEFTEEDVGKIQDLISFKEFQLYGSEDPFSESLNGLKDEIASLYKLIPEKYFIESDADLVELLPSDMKEATWLSNTSDKKSGKSPGYLSNNHDMANWGETDSDTKKDTTDDEDDDYDYNKYRRPSVDKDESDLDLDKYTSDEEDEIDKKETLKQQAVNNYYYYNYHNSLNKNNNSFNKDNSRHDNHSTKNINSHNVSTNQPNKESLDHIWTIENFNDDYIQEGWMDKLKDISSKAMNKVKSSLLAPKKTIANVQNMDDPRLIRPIGLTSIFNNIKIGDNTNISESSDINEEEILTESALDFFKRKTNLSAEKIEYAVEKLKDKFNSQILIAEDIQLIPYGGATCVSLSKDMIESIKANKQISGLIGFGTDKEYCIIISPKILNKYSYIKTEKDLINVVSHEYGHTKTMDQITQEDLEVYSRKRTIICMLMSYLKLSFKDLTPELVYFIYHQDRVEKLANEYAKVDVRELVRASCGRYPDKAKIDKVLDYEFFINWRPEIKKYKLGEDLVKTKEIFNKVVKDKFRLALFNKLIDMEIKKVEKYFSSFNSMNEAVGDADDDKPQSDHPIKDTLTDIDRGLTKVQQGAKKKVQDIQNVGKAFVKPFARTTSWINNMVNRWRDMDETKAKEKLADPHARKNLFHAIKTAIAGGSLLKAGLLLNPVFLALSAYKLATGKGRDFRMRNEMIGELKAEIEIIEEKIRDADSKRDYKAKYQLMRFKNEINKKLLRVGGGKQWAKII